MINTHLKTERDERVYVVTVMRPLLAALLVCALAPAAEAKCAVSGLKPSVLTPSGATVAPDGGLLVGAIDADDDALEAGDPASQPGWRLRLGSRVASPTLVPLAPGLVLYKLPIDTKEAQMIDDKRAVIGSVTVAAKAALGAPKIKKIMHESRLGRRPLGRVTVELTGPAPDEVVAIVLADAKGKPRSWGKIVTKGETKIRGFERSRCRVLANETVESKPGDRITVFWVDASGRKSPLSAVTTVGGVVPDPDADD